MRVMVFVKGTEDGDQGSPPSPEAFAAMDRFTEELVTAGVLVAGAGLKGGVDARCIVVEGEQRTVLDGPYAETKELVAGFAIWQVKDMDEAVAWAKRCPNCMPGRSVIEIRPFMEAEDLGELVPAEERAMPREGERGRLGVA